MNTTSVSLLRRLAEPRNEAAWGRFVELYAPLLYHWGRGRGFEEAEYRRYVVNRALQLARTDFSEQTWQACWAHAAEGRSAAEVGAELGMTANAVRVAKSRVLRRLREELSGLLD